MSSKVLGAILAGGESRRFGADKAWADIAGKPMIVRVAERLRPQVRMLALVGTSVGAEAIGAAALCDPPARVKGPLLGVCAALGWAEEQGAEWLVTAPCDTPLLPMDMVERLVAAAHSHSAHAAFAETATGVHPLCAVWSPGLRASLLDQLASGIHPNARAAVQNATHVFFDDERAFLNVNTPGDMQGVFSNY